MPTQSQSQSPSQTTRGISQSTTNAGSRAKMRSSVSERSLIIESDDDDHPQSQQPSAAAGSDSGSDSSSPCATPRVPPTASSYTQQWPQSYRSAIIFPCF